MMMIDKHIYLQKKSFMRNHDNGKRMTRDDFFSIFCICCNTLDVKHVCDRMTIDSGQRMSIL